MMSENAVRLKRIVLSGFKSIEKMDLELGAMNVLIGANGAGKSNLVSFFGLLADLVAGRLQSHIGISGGASALLFYGAETTRQCSATLMFEAASATWSYEIELVHTAADSLVFDREVHRLAIGDDEQIIDDLGAGHRETQLDALSHDDMLIGAIRQVLKDCRAFQFHDTSRSSAIRREAYIHNNNPLRNDGGNLAAVLYMLQRRHEDAYRRIVQTIQQIAPWFQDFAIAPLKLNENNVLLNWRERDSEMIFGPHQLSDGTLRAMALITLLLQPEKDLFRLIVIDEPELGLHPSAISVIAALLKQAALHCQVIVATQSPTLLDEFEPADVIVVDREGGKSTFARQSPERLRDWLTEYSLGELWQKNVMGGGPF